MTNMNARFNDGTTADEPADADTAATIQHPADLAQDSPDDASAADAGLKLAAEDGAAGGTSVVDPGVVSLPLLGSASLRRQVGRLWPLLLLGVVLFLVGLLLGLWQSQRAVKQYQLSIQASAEVQRLDAVASLVFSGNLSSQQLQQALDAANALADDIEGLQQAGQGDVTLASAAQLREAAASLAQTRGVLIDRNNGLDTIAGLADELQQELAASQQSAASLQQLFLQLRALGGMAHGLKDMTSIDLDAFAALRQDLASAQETVRQQQFRTADADLQDILQSLGNRLGDADGTIGVMLDDLPQLQKAREALLSLIYNSSGLAESLQAIEDELAPMTGWQWWQALLIVAGVLLMALAGWLMAQAYIRQGQNRFRQAEQMFQATYDREQDAKRLNDANQAAILRLMNELLLIAEGDLTQEATVTEDITGAIADSVNYTIEELRQLVASVQETANKVTGTTLQVDATSTELLATSTEQLREIKETGRAILEMAQRINDISGKAQGSASVARQSRQAAESGLRAVQDSIGGMNAIRMQIQESSKRIKRLGESSQEIGEITELISDITEQTNVLALNAAIQAASAGEAGRGFSVVAEEVQRLAERSADATRQIAELIRTIQTDMQDAVAAMERSTQGVVEGASLADRAGVALSEIDQVSRQLSELVEQISQTALKEAGLANNVAENIQHIFAVTEQTSDGTRSTAQQVRELSHIAQELRQSIARFKIQ
ncbi:methyl-accepting chemotaxis protein [Corticibacter populi]|uniref:Methyl-accepting chemotaxis protein n=1 Tax=Corticibacter populi TaxID=1550736 RepID=A0A3M6QJ11_9BURK|nr:methyl-accepting chemotaxis protein [Corticibacter populi]RMX03066.1 methyl-accepting chemotaxis protein [Corticibacter populi]RZS33362.1 twitching motility protein PilJ [Corticibacter populi]